MNHLLKKWLPVAFTLTFASSLVYGVTFYSLRHSANDPQLGLANDVAKALEKGRSTNNLLPTMLIELENGQSIYGAVYDENFKAISYSATLDGKPPEPPKGVFEHTKKHGENSVTWQPKDNIRSAIVVKRYDGIRKGYVLFGKSLLSTEQRLDWVKKAIALVWFLSLIIWAAIVLLLQREKTSKPKQPIRSRTKEQDTAKY